MLVIVRRKKITTLISRRTVNQLNNSRELPPIIYCDLVSEVGNNKRSLDVTDYRLSQ